MSKLHQSANPGTAGVFLEDLSRLAYFAVFLFVVCGAARLARFNVQKNPVPKNPGRAGRKYFVGLPIPSAAALLAAVVHAAGGYPIHSWLPWGALWLALLGLLSFLMVCTWRYYSFKDLNLLRPRSPWMFIASGTLIYLIWTVPQPVLLSMALCYMMSGIVIRVGGIVRRTLHPHREHPGESSRPEHQVG